MNCNGYMQGFDNFRIETIYQLRHIGLEMGGKIVYSRTKWIKLDSEDAPESF